MKSYVYILKCEDNHFYTGITYDLQKRFERHSVGNGSLYTKGHKAEELLYYEIFDTRSKAAVRELQIKKWSRAKKIALIAGDQNKLRALSRSND